MSNRDMSSSAATSLPHWALRVLPAMLSTVLVFSTLFPHAFEALHSCKTSARADGQQQPTI